MTHFKERVFLFALVQGKQLHGLCRGGWGVVEGIEECLARVWRSGGGS